jgi:hypothetical protein
MIWNLGRKRCGVASWELSTADVGDSVFYHSLLVFASPQQLLESFVRKRLVAQPVYRCEMRSMAFLDPGAFIGTNPADEPMTSFAQIAGVFCMHNGMFCMS